MPKSTSLPNLTVLAALKAISDAISAAGEPLTATRLKRALTMTDKLFDEAVEFGCAEKYLKWSTRNFYSNVKPYVVPEEAYYGDVKGAIDALWLKEGYERSHFYTENTSRRDSKIVGPWTRPDLTLVSYKKFAWTIGSEFDVVTFEVKRPENADVLAVFEALSHVSAATRAYAVFPIDADVWRSANPQQEKRVKDECVRHGVGLILVDPTSNGPVAHHVLKAARREIDHEKCSDFLDAVLSDAGKRSISQWKS